MGFLTGDPVAAVPTSKSEEVVLPDWYTNYAMNVLANQQAIAAQPYRTYQGPRLAEFTAPQQQAFAQTAQASQAYQPGLQAATQVAQQASPYMGLAAASPYLQQAGQTAASQVGQYMNPYVDAVVGRIGQLGARTLQEQLLPSIRDKFIAGGTYGGSRQAEMFGRGLRDVYESTLAQQAQALSQGYQGALGAAQTDLARQAGLAGTAGQLGTSATSAGLQQAGTLADFAQRAQQLGLTGAQALGQVGAQQQGLNQQNLELAYQDFLRQQAYPQEQQKGLISALQGVGPAVPKAAISTGTEVPSSFQPSTLQQIASILGALKGIS